MAAIHLQICRLFLSVYIHTYVSKNVYIYIYTFFDSSSSTLIVLAAGQRGCTINAIDCMYSKLPTEDE